MLRSMWRCWPVLALMAALGCENLSDFRTDPGEVYRGDIEGVNDPENCPGDIDCSFIRRGFPSGVTLDLTFDPEQQYAVPGTISTRGEDCGPTFVDTPLLAIVPLAHDQLGLYDFPGSGRLRNFMFVAQPETGPLAGRDAMVFISLLRDGGVEARIIAGPGSVICDPADCAALESGLCDYFGVFRLGKEQL